MVFANGKSPAKEQRDSSRPERKVAAGVVTFLIHLDDVFVILTSRFATRLTAALGSQCIKKEAIHRLIGPHIGTPTR